MSKKRAIKVLLIGDASVGKTCIFKAFSKKPYNDQNSTTVGVDFVFEDVTVNDETIKLQLWDTAGHERFDTITTSYYRGAHGILLCSSCDDRDSFDNIDKWVRKVNENEKKVIIFLVQTKCDIEEDDRSISKKEFAEVANKNKFDYFHVSAKSNTNIDSMITTACSKILKDLNAKQNSLAEDQVVSIDPNQPEKKKGCRC